MNLIDFYRIEQKRLHAELRQSLDELSAEQWHYALGGTSNSIAFLFWHIVRTEDNVLRLILEERKPIWAEGNWATRLNLPSRAQGTGMTTGEAQAITLSDPALFMQYADQVWQEFETYLANVNDGGVALSARIVMVKPLGEMPAIQAIGQVCLTHLYVHYGEIALLVGAQGKQGQPR
jgi:hypothetical protein